MSEWLSQTDYINSIAKELLKPRQEYYSEDTFRTNLTIKKSESTSILSYISAISKPITPSISSSTQYSSTNDNKFLNTV